MNGEVAAADEPGSAPATGRSSVRAASVPLDARLVPTAVGCWIATIVGVALGWRFGVATAVVLAAAALASAVVVRRGGVRPSRRGVAWSVLAALTAASGFALAAAWQEYRVSTHPLSLLSAGSTVTAEVVVGDPKPLPGRSFGGRQWLMRATLVEFRYGATTTRGEAAVTVIMPERGWSALVPGQHVRFRAELDRPWRRDLTVAVLRAEGPPQAGPRPWWQAAATRVRTDLAAAAQRALPPDAAGVLPGLIDGDVSRVPDEVRENFRAVDLTHLLAVSGTNVSIVLGAVLLSTRALTLDPRWGAILAGLALLGFVVLARPSPSVLRAAAMGAIAILAILTGRRKQALPALCTAMIVLLAIWPELAVDIGFALSVLATGALILVAPSWSQWLERRGWPPLMAQAFGVAAAAFAVTTPIIAALTGKVSGLAIVANVLVEPVVAPVTVLGVVAAALSCLWQPAAIWVLNLTELPMWWLLTVAEHTAALGVTLPIPSGAAGALLGLLLVVIAVALLARVGARRGRPPSRALEGAPPGRVVRSEGRNSGSTARRRGS